MRRVIPIPFPQDPLVGDAAELGLAIRAARCASGMTLVDAAVTLGLSKQTLADLERAKGSVGVVTALRVARELGVAIFAVPAADRELVRRAIQSVRTGDDKSLEQAVDRKVSGKKRGPQ